mmetsp:Transcript_13916/g.24883  ORF Transcript_13916/g.24883 Transcript_13916/m.24883 type:complete len:268 (+) Transcript_13916:266-1069(+)
MAASLRKGLRQPWVIFGANTDVGKTVVAGGLVRSACAAFGPSHTDYIKILQTGTDEGHSDERFVRNAASVADPKDKLRSKTLFSWGPAVSPHLAAEQLRWVDGQLPPSDAEVLKATRDAVAAAKSDSRATFIETAGGVLSPGPTGQMQADMYKPLSMPVLMVGDGRLGGISTTLTAYEALYHRKMNVPVVAVIGDPEERYGNVEFLSHMLAPYGVKVFALKSLPEPEVPLEQWYAFQQPRFDAMLKLLMEANPEEQSKEEEFDVTCD